MATIKPRPNRARKAARPDTRNARPAAPFDEPLHDVIRHLRLAAATVVVCVDSLQRRNIELDREMALLLRRGASDRLHAQIERLEGLAASRPPRA
jgi:hypothetical protein